jgi:putative ABC transport system permease protein
MAIRLALGAGRSRLLRQVLTESALLALAGGALGVLLAWLGTRALVMFNAGSIPRLEEARVDGVVLGFSLAASALTGMLIGLVPALQQSQTALRAALGEGTRSSRGGPARRARNALIVGQVAMGFVVLIAAGLLGRSLLALQRVPPGFDPRDVMAMQVSPPRATYDSAYKVIAFLERVQSELRTIPGAEVSAVYPLPASGESWSGSFVIEGNGARRRETLLHAEYGVVAPGYFRTMRIPLLEGRDFSTDDRRGSPGVVIVDEVLARQNWPGQSAIGKRLNTRGPNGEWDEIVGVVRHVRNAGPREDGEGQIYYPVLQRPQRPVALVVRTAASPASVGPAMRAALRKVDPNLPASRLDRMEQLVSATFARDRFNTIIIAVFAIAALVLPSVGLYGVMASAVAQRTREIAIRSALGGRPNALRWMVMREGLLVALTGIGTGGLASLATAGALRSLLYDVAPTDVPTYAGIALLLLLVVLVAAHGPARRATRVDPMIALRE